MSRDPSNGPPGPRSVRRRERGAGVRARATATAEESTYAGIVRLVRDAEREKAPAVRLADRYAAIFIPVTLVIAGVAWAITGDATP